MFACYVCTQLTRLSNSIYISHCFFCTLCISSPDSFLVLQMRLCRGNGAQVHNSERDPETGTATGETSLCFADGCLETVMYMMMLMSSGMSSLSGHQSGSVQHQHRRALCHPQRVYPYTVLQVRLCCTHNLS